MREFNKRTVITFFIAILLTVPCVLRMIETTEITKGRVIAREKISNFFDSTQNIFAVSETNEVYRVQRESLSGYEEGNCVSLMVKQNLLYSILGLKSRKAIVMLPILPFGNCPYGYVSEVK